MRASTSVSEIFIMPSPVPRLAEVTLEEKMGQPSWPTDADREMLVKMLTQAMA